MGIPYEADPHLNLPVLLFTLGVSIFAGIFFGCAPAWHASRQNVSDMLKEGGRSSAGRHAIRLRSLLVIAEFALALVLVAGAGLIIRSFVNLAQADLGIQTDHVLTFRVPLQNERKVNAEQVRSLYAELLNRIQVVPGVYSVAAAPGLPAAGSGQLHFTIVGQPHEGDVNKQPFTVFMPVTPGYYKTYGIRLVRGRYLNAEDRAGGVRVAMVSEGFVKKFLPGLEPLGQRVRIPELIPGSVQELGAPVEWQVVGVFHDVQYDSHPKSESTEVDVPFDQSPWVYTTIAVRTVGIPEAVTKSVAAAVRSVNPDYPMTRIRSMEQVVSESLIADRFAVVTFGSFALLALILAAVGIYGVMTFSVAQRNHEMGIRMALGAGTLQVLRHIVGEGMRAALIGMAVGLPGAYFVGRIMRSQLYNVASIDGPALLVVTAVLLVSALLACYWPARRAAKIDPLVALREG